MKKSVDSARAREDEMEKELIDLKRMIKVKEEENVSLRADLQLQHQENQGVKNDWEEKYEALQRRLQQTGGLVQIWRKMEKCYSCISRTLTFSRPTGERDHEAGKERAQTNTSHGTNSRVAPC